MPVWIDAGDQSGPIEVGLINAAGQTMYRDLLYGSGNLWQMTVSRPLPAGIYQLVFLLEDRSVARKIAVR
jgi:hypothetical protein